MSAGAVLGAQGKEQSKSSGLASNRALARDVSLAVCKDPNDGDWLELDILRVIAQDGDCDDMGLLVSLEASVVCLCVLLHETDWLYGRRKGIACVQGLAEMTPDRLHLTSSAANGQHLSASAEQYLLDGRDQQQTCSHEA